MQETRLDRLRGPAVALAALLFAGGLLLFEALFGGKVLTQADALFQFPPWSDVAPPGYAPENPLLLDQSIVMQPWFHFGAERAHAGTPPWWNPDNYLGQPMVGTYQTAYFWPLTWVYLAFPTWGWYAWSALLRIALAGFFTFLFLRALGVRAGPATVGGLGYALSGFMIAWLGHMHTHVAPLLPAMLWAIERIARRPTLRNAALLGLFAGGALLAGHVQTAVHLGLAVAAYAAFRALVGLPTGASAPPAIHHRPHPPGIAAAPEGCAPGSDFPPSEPPSGPTPAAELRDLGSGKEPHRPGSPEEPHRPGSPEEPHRPGSPEEPHRPGFPEGARRREPAEDSPRTRGLLAQPHRLGRRGLLLTAAGALAGGMLAMPQLLPFLDYLSTSSGAVVLEHFETVSDVDPRAPASLMVAPGRFGSPAAAQGYGPYTGPSGWNVNYNELIGGYVGRALLVLALLQVAWLWRAGQRRATWFFLALAVVAAGVAWQVWPFYDVANAIPKLRSTKLMRASVLLAFALSVLGALGLDGLARRLRLAGVRATALFAVAALVVGGELIAFGRGYNPMIAPELVTPPTPVTDFLRAQPGLWRVLGVENTALIPSANLFYGIPLVAGYDSMETRTTTELVALMSSDPDGEFFIKEIDFFDQAPAIGDLLGVRYLLSGQPLPPPYELALDGPTQVYANPNALPRAFAATSLVVRAEPDERLATLGDPAFDPRIAVLEHAPPPGLAEDTPLGAGAVELAHYGDLELRITTRLDAPGLVVVTDAWDESWHAYVDGEPALLLRVDHALRGVAVGAGEHAIEMRYEPWALRAGLAIGLVALAVLLFGLLLGGARMPRTRWDGAGRP